MGTQIIWKYYWQINLIILIIFIKYIKSKNNRIFKILNNQIVLIMISYQLLSIEFIVIIVGL